MPTLSRGKPSLPYTATQGPAYVCNPLHMSTYNSMPRCMSTNSCQYNLNSGQKSCLMSPLPPAAAPPWPACLSTPQPTEMLPRRAARPIDAMESAKRAQSSASSELTFPPRAVASSTTGKSFSQTAKCKAVASSQRYPRRKVLRIRRLTEGAIGVRLSVRRNRRPSSLRSRRWGCYPSVSGRPRSVRSRGGCPVG